MKIVARALAIAGLLAALLVPAGSVSAASVRTVHPGQSIQAAINASAAGDTVVVLRATYRENLLITKSIRLIGIGAVLRPAASPTPNICGQFEGGQPTGICITGALSEMGLVTRPVEDVSLQGFTVAGFGAMGVFAIGVDGFRAAYNTFANNGDYGIFANQSSSVALLYNVARNNGAPGIYVGDSPAANAAIVGNLSYNNLGEGILYRDALGGRISLNNVYGNCEGITILDTGAPGAGGNVSVALNQVTANNRLCPGEAGEAPPLGGFGIAVFGAQNTTVVLNLVRNNVSQTGSAIPGGGIVLLDTTTFGGGPPHDNKVQRNILSGNTPQDIAGDATGSNNTVSGNTCTNTNVAGAC